MSNMDIGSLTEFGFTWGPIEVQRATSMERRPGAGLSRCLRVRTEFDEVSVYVSPTGRSVRVFRDGKELK